MPAQRTVSFPISDLWYGTAEEYAAARRHVRTLIVATWAQAMRRVPITPR